MGSITIALLALLASQTVSGACPQDGCPEHTSARTLLQRGVNACASKEYPAGGSRLAPMELPDTSFTSIHWAGVEHDKDKYVFLITNDAGGRLWRSSEHGRAGTFTDVTEQLPGAGEMQGEGRYARMNGITTIHHHNAHDGKLLIQGEGYLFWKTEDFGATFKAIPSPGNTSDSATKIRLHPNKPDWLLAKTQRLSCLDYWWSNSCVSDLFASQDFGDSWLNLTANSKGYIVAFDDFDWGAAMHKGKRQDVVDETILATAYESEEYMKGPYSGWDKDQHFVISHDFFATQHQKVVSCGNQFEIIGDKVYLAIPSFCPQFPDGGSRDACREPSLGSVLLFVSDDEAQTFTQACIPARDLDFSYRFLPSHNGEGSFVMIDHDEQQVVKSLAPMSSVYAAGEGSSVFSLVLPRAFASNGHVDFSRVEGVPGVYLANSVAPSPYEDASYSDAYFYDFYYDTYGDHVTTKVSFNGGAHWQEIERPDYFRHPDCDQCSQMPDPSQCKLHLHGPTSFHQWSGSKATFYSHYSAPGIIMAVGNVGEHLESASNNLCTWISSDAGLTWQDVADTPQIYEIGDQGGIIVMGNYRTQEPANHLHFSLDSGACWHKVLLSEPIDIDNIMVEPQASSRIFMVTGKACRKTDAHPECTHDMPGASPAGKLYVVDIEAVLGSDFRVCNEDEYTLWSPPRPEQCLLGRNYTLHRRKPEAACFNANGWQRPANSSHACACQAADLACEFGYEAIGTICEPVPKIDASLCPAFSGSGHGANGKYTMSETHKRLIQGDVCEGIQRVIPDTDGKGNASSAGGRRMSWWMWLWIVPLAAIGIGGFGFACWKILANEDIKERCLDSLMAAGSSLSENYRRLRGRLTGDHATGRPEEDYFQPLASGDEFAFNLSEEDARSPPLFPGS